MNVQEESLKCAAKFSSVKCIFASIEQTDCYNRAWMESWTEKTEIQSWAERGLKIC